VSVSVGSVVEVVAVGSVVEVVIPSESELPEVDGSVSVTAIVMVMLAVPVVDEEVSESDVASVVVVTASSPLHPVAVRRAAAVRSRANG